MFTVLRSSVEATQRVDQMVPGAVAYTVFKGSNDFLVPGSNKINISCEQDTVAHIQEEGSHLSGNVNRAVNPKNGDCSCRQCLQMNHA